MRVRRRQTLPLSERGLKRRLHDASDAASKANTAPHQPMRTTTTADVSRAARLAHSCGSKGGVHGRVAYCTAAALDCLFVDTRHRQTMVNVALTPGCRLPTHSRTRQLNEHEVLLIGDSTVCRVLTHSKHTLAVALVFKVQSCIALQSFA